MIETPHTKQYIAVTGATGFIGRAFVQHMVHHGYGVYAIVRSEKKAGMLFSELSGVTVVECALADVEKLQAVFAEVSGVVHIAGAKNDETDSVETNVDGARTIVAAAEKAHVQWLINISTQSVKISDKGLYAATKYAAEQIFHASNIPVTTLRLSLVYGDEPSGVSAMVVRGASWPVFPMVGSGEANFCPIHVEDVGETIRLCIEKKVFFGMRYDVGGPDEVTLNEYVALLSTKISGRKITILHLPIWLWMLLAKLCKFLFTNPPISVSNVRGASARISIDAAPLQNLLHFTPRSLGDGVEVLIKKNTSAHEEARAILHYGVRSLGMRYTIKTSDVQTFVAACAAHGVPDVCFRKWIYNSPWILALLDAGSALCGRRSAMRKKFLIAAALLECTPAAAERLLPRQSFWLLVLVRSFFQLIKAGCLAIFGCAAWVIRKIFITSYANHSL